MDYKNGGRLFISSSSSTAFRVSPKHALTAFHCLYEWGICTGPTRSPLDRMIVAKVIAFDSDGQPFSAKVLAADPCSDVTVLEILGVNPADPFLEPSVIDPTRRQFIWRTGFSNRVIKPADGRIFKPKVSLHPALATQFSHYSTHLSSDFHVGYLRLSAEDGDSGGPIMDAEGGVQFIVNAILSTEGYRHLTLGVPIEYGMKLLEYGLKKYEGETVFVNHSELFGK